MNARHSAGTLGNDAIGLSFAEAEVRHANAAALEVRRTVIDFGPVTEIARACAGIFRASDRDDEFQRRTTRDAWLLKAAISYTLLPFDDPRLELTFTLGRLREAAFSMPAIDTYVDTMAQIIDHLRIRPTNPKLQRVEDALRDAREGTVGIMARLCEGDTPGWPRGIALPVIRENVDLRLLKARRDYVNRSFDLVIVPGSCRFASRRMLLDLIFGGTAPRVELISYASERSDEPRPVGIPGSLVSRDHDHTSDPNVTEELQIDAWANSAFWSEVRDKALGVNAPLNVADVMESARFVLFANGKGAFLPEEKSIVEVSSLLDGTDGGAGSDRLPKKQVRDLEDGDLVMLRLEGGGDYVETVADSLMEAAGKNDLRPRALEWKARLMGVLKRHGEGMVAARLSQWGVALRDQKYLWTWAGDSVIAPHDFRTFEALCSAIWSFEPMSDDLEVRSYAERKWDEIESLKAYHQRAGAAIRATLVEQVRQLIIQRKRVETVETIELPGVEAGRMGLLRVSAVDHSSISVPHSRLYHFSRIDRD